MSETRALANQEREYQVRRLGKLGRALLLSIASLMSLLTLVLLVADQLFHPEAFVIKEMKIKGKFRYLQPADVDAVLRSQDLGNFFSVELNQLKTKVEEMEWVQSADIRRQWPNTLNISIVEHQPAMRWGKDKWVSTSGSIITLPADIEADGVVVLKGDETRSKQILVQAARWKKELAEQGLKLREAQWSNSQAWTLKLYSPELDSEFSLLLGSQSVVARLERFKVLFNVQLKSSGHRLKRVDARYPDGLAVQHGEKIILETSDSSVSLVSQQQLVSMMPIQF